MNRPSLHLTDFIAAEHLQEAQDMFAAVENVPTLILDHNGEKITEVSPSECRSFCHTSSVCGMVCKAHAEELLDSCSRNGKPAISPCPVHGFSTAAVPIVVDGLFLGAWILGQGGVIPPPPDKVEQTMRELRLTRATATSMLERHCRIPLRRFHRLLGVLQFYASIVGKQAMRNKCLSQERPAPVKAAFSPQGRFPK